MPVHWAARAEAAKENGGDESDEQQGTNNGANDGATGRRIAAVATVDAVAVGAALLFVTTVGICGTRASARRAQTFPRAGAARCVITAVGVRRTTGATTGSTQTFPQAITARCAIATVGVRRTTGATAGSAQTFS